MEDRQAILGSTIARLRREAGLSQEAVADRAGIHAVMVSRVERGATDPRVSTLLRIADGLGLPPAAMFEDL